MTSPSSDAFDVELDRRADKDLSGHPGNRKRILAALDQLASNPYRGQQLRGRLHDVRSLHFAVPGAQFRAAYLVQPSRRRVLVFCVAPRENFYDEVERRYSSTDA